MKRYGAKALLALLLALSMLLSGMTVLADDIARRVENLPEDERQALLSVIAEEFPTRTITVDGEEFEGFSIDVVIDRDGEKTYERYTFYNDGAQWILYGIEVGEYRVVE